MYIKKKVLYQVDLKLACVHFGTSNYKQLLKPEMLPLIYFIKTNPSTKIDHLKF